jgi:hypothetical protein
MTAFGKHWIEEIYSLCSDMRPTPILTDAQWRIYEGLTSAYNQDEWVIFAGCGLTPFFDPDARNLRRDERNGLFKHSALFVIARGEQRLNVKPSLFVIDQASLETGAQDYFDSWGVDYILYDPTIAPEEFVDLIRSRIEGNGKIFVDRRPINLAERNVARQIASDSDFVALHEVSLRRLFPRLPFHDEALDKELLKVGPIDIVIHSLNPNAPVLCVEVDGRTHMESRQQEKDKVKTKLIELAGIPLMRILPGDCKALANLTENLLDEDSRKYAQLIGRWAAGISKEFARNLDIDQVKSQHEAKRNAARRKLASALFGKSYDDLTEDQAGAIENNELIAELMLDEYYDMLEFAEPDYPLDDDRAEFMSVPPRLEGRMVNPVPHGTLENGIWVEAALRTASGSENIKSPKFFLKNPQMSEGEIKEKLIRLAFAFVCRLADRKLTAAGNQRRRGI